MRTPKLLAIVVAAGFVVIANAYFIGKITSSALLAFGVLVPWWAVTILCMPFVPLFLLYISSLFERITRGDHT